MINKFPTRVLIIDDHPMVRDGLTMRVQMQPDLEVCGEAETVTEGMEFVRRLKPDLLIVDISLKSGSGLDLIKQAVAIDSDIKVLVCSMYDEELYSERALRAGALGYIHKQETREKLIEAIRTVIAGKRYLSPDMTQRMLHLAIEGSAAGVSPIHSLTDRELEIFQLIGEGLATGAIAKRLHISTHTIDSHREKIKVKLGVKTAAELQRQAVQWTLENQ